MKALGIKNIVDFPFMTSPTEETLIRSLELLHTLKAIDINGELTKDIGEKLCELPLEARLGVVFINSLSDEFSCA